MLIFPKVCKVLQAHRVSKDPWVKEELQVLLDLLDLQVLEVFQVFQEKTVKVGEMENKDHKVLLDPQVKEDCLVCLVYLDLRDTEAFLVLMEQKVVLEDLVRKEKKVRLDLLDHQDPWDQLDQEGKEEERDLLDPPASGVLME